MTANERRKARIASLTNQARKLRDEAARGFADFIHEGRTIATAAEIERSAWRLIGSCESQAEKLREKIR
jgi:hypothetical protein